ncbi:MAG TPA: lysophospholipid acyltransferase family protein [Sphingorhabdus sp.]|jgi:1-acyl-sn-glycerol-3-phosphate acyltransferase|nr:lysophospholipid acyltransferase family protein [Sphingorhabdus sp.]
MTKEGSRAARRYETAFFVRLLNGFGVRRLYHGVRSPLPGTLFVSNHISWTDIPLLAAALNADFVAKSEIARWPVVGRLARRLNPVFVARNGKGCVRSQADAIRERLAAGRSVILFAEGTTSVGDTVLPFRSSLFEAADTARLIQPLTILYSETDSNPLPPDRMREIAWIDDDGLVSGALRVARKHTLAQVMFLPPVAAIPNRKLLAQACWGLIEAAYRERAIRDAEPPEWRKW